MDSGRRSSGWWRAHSRAMRQLDHFFFATRSNRIAQKHPRPPITVAISVRDEIERVERCVEALAEQRDAFGSLLGRGEIRVVLLVNGSTDGTYPFILENMERWRVAISAFDVRLPASRQNAGCARWIANHVALDVLPDRGGLLFMTDADSAVPVDWIARYSAMLRGGYDAVAGLVDLHPDDCGDISSSLAHRGALEDRYSLLLDRLESSIDPLPHDPWPRHYTASGANIAVRADALRGLDDFPQVSCGEDRLFIDRLQAQGRRIRHDCATRVSTSGRIVGRACGGMADTLRLRIHSPDTACDPRLESADSAYRRATLRKRLRAAWLDRHAVFQDGADAWLGQHPSGKRFLSEAMTRRTFEDAWWALEGSLPHLKRTPLLPSQLPAQIERAEYLLRTLSTGQAVQHAERSQEAFA